MFSQGAQSPKEIWITNSVWKSLTQKVNEKVEICGINNVEAEERGISLLKRILFSIESILCLESLLIWISFRAG